MSGLGCSFALPSLPSTRAVLYLMASSAESFTYWHEGWPAPLRLGDHADRPGYQPVGRLASGALRAWSIRGLFACLLLAALAGKIQASSSTPRDFHAAIIELLA